jgi:hypothetical protein
MLAAPAVNYIVQLAIEYTALKYMKNGYGSWMAGITQTNRNEKAPTAYSCVYVAEQHCYR